MTRIAFLGFGEVASYLAPALARAGAEVVAHDVLMQRPGGMDTLRMRTRDAAVTFLPREDFAEANIVLSTVTTDVALQAAESVAAHLRPGMTYVDLNAASPARKKAIAAAIAPSGADFVEGAILPAIAVMGAKSKVLVCGKRAREIAATLTSLGLNVVDYGETIGRASSFKMLRSVFSKGFEALLLECRLAGRRAGVEADLWREIVATLDAGSFETIGGTWIRTHATAHARRYHEMLEVEALLRDLGVDPVMTQATVRLFDRSTRYALKDSFAQPPEDAAAVIAVLDAKLKNETTS